MHIIDKIITQSTALISQVYKFTEVNMDATHVRLWHGSYCTMNVKQFNHFATNLRTSNTGAIAVQPIFHLSPKHWPAGEKAYLPDATSCPGSKKTFTILIFPLTSSFNDGLHSLFHPYLHLICCLHRIVTSVSFHWHKCQRKCDMIVCSDSDKELAWVRLQT